MSDAPSSAPAKRVGFLELFFDLVFVFAVTQLVGLLHDDHTAGGWARSGLMLWLVWWAWSQYTWAGNAIDLERPVMRVFVLASTGTMLVAAAAIPGAYGDAGDALLFAVPYVTVRLLGLALYWAGLAGDPDHRAALRTYLPVQVMSPLVVLAGGMLDQGVRPWVWAVAIAVDVASVLAAGRGEFRVDPAHFAERHGLIVIIALGETVIATGATASDLGLTRDVVVLLAVSFVAVAGLWWCTFDWVHPAAEHRLATEPDHRRRSHLARDLFTFGHLPIVAGTIVLAAAVEEALLHPTDRLEPFATTALAAGVGLYLSGYVLGNLRATGRVLPSRTVGLVVAVAVALVAGRTTDAVVAVGLVAAVVVAIAVWERIGPHAPAVTRPGTVHQA